MKHRLVQDRFRTMGTQASVDLVADESLSEDAVRRILQGVRGIFEKNERIFSRFDEDSELSRLNRQAGRMTRVSSEMFQALELAIGFSRRFPGKFDPRVIEQLEGSGYDRDFMKFDPGDKRDAPFPETDGGRFRKPFSETSEIVDREKKEVRLSSRIDLSGIVKGMTIDQAARQLKAEGCSDFIVEAGGDMHVSGKNEKGDDWLIDVEGAENNIRMPGGGQGVATSGISRRRWTREGKKYHHLIDPERPGDFDFGLKSVTVIAADALEADVLAKCLFLLGREKGLQLSERQGLKSLFLDYHNHSYVSSKIKDNLA